MNGQPTNRQVVNGQATIRLVIKQQAVKGPMFKIQRQVCTPADAQAAAM